MVWACRLKYFYWCGWFLCKRRHVVSSNCITVSEQHNLINKTSPASFFTLLGWASNPFGIKMETVRWEEEQEKTNWALKDDVSRQEALLSDGRHQWDQSEDREVQPGAASPAGHWQGLPPLRDSLHQQVSSPPVKPHRYQSHGFLGEPGTT